MASAPWGVYEPKEQAVRSHWSQVGASESAGHQQPGGKGHGSGCQQVPASTQARAPSFPLRGGVWPLPHSWMQRRLVGITHQNTHEAGELEQNLRPSPPQVLTFQVAGLCESESYREKLGTE